jgi:hypothetical protein
VRPADEPNRAGEEAVSAAFFLVVFWVGVNTGASFIEYPSREACEQVLDRLVHDRNFDWSNHYALCVPRDRAKA